MNNRKKMLSSLLALSLLAGCGVFAANLQPKSFNAAHDKESTSIKKKAYDDDFADEVFVNGEELGASIVQSTTTETSQSLTISFRSKTLVGFKSSRQNYIVQIDDVNFSGDLDNPAQDGYDIFNEDTNLPQFNGYISYITGSSGSGSKDVFIPSYMTRDGSFTIKIVGISTGAVSATGEEYNGKNTWYNDASNLKIQNIYIPNTVEDVQRHAIMGVPAEAVVHVEGSAVPATYDPEWTDATGDSLDVSPNSYRTPSMKNGGVGGTVDDIVDALGRPINFILGQKTKPLVMQYDKVVTENGVEVSRETFYDELPLANTSGSAYDSVGKISSLYYSRLLGYKLASNEIIDDHSIVFHNIYKTVDNGSEVDTTQRYKIIPDIGYSEKQPFSHLLSFKASMNSTFAGYSMFTLTMDKNLSITSEKYPEPHSLYLDVKPDIYEQNKTAIKEGTTKIRYSLYNLYNSFYHFKYIGSNGEVKDLEIPISSVITYQTLNQDKNNKVSVLLKNSDVAPDFSAEKVILFELKDITIQMDLLATSASGSSSVLGKSAISFKFAYITVFETEKLSVFSWDLFLILFFIGYAVLFAAGAVGLFFVLKEKFKNDEFRRINPKKYLKQAILGGIGTGIIVAAIMFIIMRTTGFANTIVVFNPTDPLLIAFSIAGMIILGYFIVLLIKLIKAEKERRKIIRLKLDEDVEDDGTN